MTTMPQSPAVTAFLAFRQASRLRRNERSITSSHVSAGLGALVRTVMHLAGFLFLTWAGFTLNMTAGLAVAALSCFVFSALAVPAKSSAEKATNDPMLRR